MEYKPSIVEYFSTQQRNCGYCSSSDSSHSYGLHAHTLKVEDYQEMIDRGWRRCGKYCYKPIMETSCCPLYTIRCAAKEFKLSKTQKKILKRFNNFLEKGTIGKDKIHKSTDIVQHMETEIIENKKNIADENNIKINTSCIDVKNDILEKPSKSSNIGKSTCDISMEEVEKQKIENVPSNIKVEAVTNRGIKKKQLRIERKKQKLMKLGLKGEELAKKLIEKKKYPVIKTIEDFLKVPSIENPAHKLKINLVRTCPRSDEFNDTFSDTFELYKRYQCFIHKDDPEKITTSRFERFLVVSPLQIKLILVNSSDFKKTFIESARLFAKYQKHVHHESDSDCGIDTFIGFLVDSPLENIRQNIRQGEKFSTRQRKTAVKGYGSFHQQYWLDEKLIAVGVVDILPKCVSSVYFFYDPDYSFLSLGTYGALREVEFTRKISSHYPELIYYYMGFYIHSCVKMKYKGAFKPSYLLCPEVYSWHLIQDCLPKLDVSKYSRLNENSNARDVNANMTNSEILILYNATAMSLDEYYRRKKCDPDERNIIMEYAKLIGRECAKSMLLFRSRD